ncbi:MAG TPA: hypothetical protein VM011_01290 [Gammaproteobacteria bacterium]|nr:hypothetical protein [Gammaproteobacteria bacterium]
MTKSISWAKRLCSGGLVASMLLTSVAGPAFADPPGGYSDRDDHRGNRDERKDGRDKRDDRRDRDGRRDRDVRHDRDEPVVWGKRRNPGYEPRVQDRRYAPDYRYRDNRKSPQIVYRGTPRNRIRKYRDVVIVRPYGHWYSGYGHYHRDDDAYKWLAFTAITLGVLNYLNEAQQREYEAAQISATTAPLGEPIIWQQGGASGAVIATREGTTPSGRYCREFQQNVSIGGQREQAYGTACRNPDGSWEVISTGGQ